MENMELYNRWRKPPAEACKPFDNGRFKGTDISPMWRIRALTEAFGPCGIGWKYEITREWTESNGPKKAAFVDVNLYINVNGSWSEAIPGTGGNVLSRKENDLSDEGYKMALTDAIGIACKALGMGADVWWDNDPTAKYSASQNQDGPPEKPAVICEACGKEILGTVDASGVEWTPKKLVEFSRKEYRKNLCYSCIGKRMTAK